MLQKLTYDIIIALAKFVGKPKSIVYATHHPKVLEILEQVRTEVYEVRREMAEIELQAFETFDALSHPLEWKDRGINTVDDIGKRAERFYRRIHQLNQNTPVPSIGMEKIQREKRR